jgi:DNA-binding PadR family transcriptional regulator
VLHSFEQQGIVEGYWESSADPGPDVEETGRPDAVRRGPRRRYYRLTPRGLLALRSALSEWHAFSGAVTQVLGESRASLA